MSFAVLRLLFRPFLLLMLFAGMALPAGAQQANPLDSVVRVTSTVSRDSNSAAGLGTTREGHGVVIDGKGLVLTIGYLILEASEVKIETGEGKTVPAEVVAYDYDSGFGMVRAIGPLPVPPMKLGDSSAANVMDRVLVAGAGGRASTIGAEIVSRRTFAGYWEYLIDGALFTTPPHRDWGGAALINNKGELIGIGSLFVRDTVPGEGTRPGNMFVPINLLKPIMADMLATGRAPGKPRPWVGINSQEVQNMVVVTNLSSRGPAAKAGVLPGDIIVSVGKKRVQNQIDFYRTLWSQGEAGTQIELRIMRDGKTLDFKIPSGSRYEVLKQGGSSL